MTNKLPYLLVLAVVAIAFFVGYCNKPEPVTPAVPAEQDRKSITGNDRIASAIEAKYQDSLKAQIKAANERDSLRLVQIAELRQKSAQALAEYRKTPTLPNCNTAVNALEQENAQQAVALVECDSAKQVRDRLIWAQTGTITRKSGVIDSLDLGWQKANETNAVLREQVRKAKGKRFGIGPNVTGTLLNGKPAAVIGIGIQYNLVKF